MSGPTDQGDDALSPFDRALDEVLDQPPDARRAYVEARFVDEPELKARLLGLLTAHDQAEGFLADALEEIRSVMEGDGSDLPAGDAVEGPIPERIGPYQVIERLGRGGMGIVYRARHRDGSLDRDVALKVISQRDAAPELRRRFEAERRILSRLEHPHVARLYDVGFAEDGAPYLAMELVDGVPITEYADTGSLGIPERLALVRQLTDALAYAHRNLIVHRDVKPSNILVSAEGSVKLLDFGVAKLLEAEGDVATTRTGGVMLTPEYASPEQIRGEPITTATDVYATGILLYELLVGTRPYAFTNRSPVHIEQIISREEPSRPSAAAARVTDDEADRRASTPARLARTLAGDLDNIVLKALRKDPSERYGSVQQLAADLDRYRDHEPVEARAPTLAYRARKFLARHRLPVASAALIVVALTGGLGVAAWQAERATVEARRAERVKDLLVGLFQGSDPDASLGEDLTALELLERGEASLLDELDEEPTVRAELLQVVGTVYRDLGAYDRAEPLLEAAVELLRDQGDEGALVSAIASLAALRHATGRYDEGEELARERLEALRRIGEGRTTTMAAALTDLASMLGNQGLHEEAEALLLEGLEIDREVGDLERVATDLNNLADLQTDMGRYEESIATHEESLAIRRELLGDLHTDVATSEANLAFALDSRGEFDRAEPHFQEALRIRRQLLGDEHALVATVLNNLASMRQKQRRYQEARTLHEEALAIRRAVFGDDHGDVAGSLNNLGIVSYFESDYETAETRFREALRIFRLNLSEDHPYVMTGVNNLAAVLREQGKLDESEALFRETLANRLEVLGPDHSNTGGAWNNLAALLILQGRPAEAEEAGREAIRVFTEAFTADHPDRLNAMLTLGRSLVMQDRGAEAVDGLREACAGMDENRGAGDAAAARCHAILGVARWQAGDAEGARAEIAPVIELLEAERADDEWTGRARGVLDGLGGG